MNEYRIEYARMPTAHNPMQVMFIEADSPDEALKKAYSRLERSAGIAASQFVWGEPTEIAERDRS